ncbi:non-ous end-joining factor 1 [Holotrichia oblita]|uniref:Non-ous end-joining factor 1 n=1 Tax=Holotrichia oblita TaxID=644536 RepID=A0ACB9SZR8_HOLOL|nr:non-ous end-joining factor 1 [Holotrichia oblita]
MWKSFQFENDVYLIKFTSDSTHTFYLTDLQSLWMEELDDDEMQERFQSQNRFCIDANVAEEIKTLINSASSDTVQITKNDTVISMEINVKVDDFPLKFYWKLDVQSSDELFRIFTLSLINTIQYLELEQGRLHEILGKKDREIEEYKKEYGEISRDVLKTEKFVKKDGVDTTGSELLLDMLTNKDIFPQLMNKYGTEAVKKKSKSLEKSGPKKKKLKPYIPKHVT